MSNNRVQRNILEFYYAMFWTICYAVLLKNILRPSGPVSIYITLNTRLTRQASM